MKIFLNLLFMVVLLSSCSLDEPDKDLIVQVDTDFRLSVAEDLNSPGVFIFDVETTEERECRNSAVDLQLISGNEGLTLHINDITDPADCEAGNSPARGSASTGKLSDGSFDLKIVVQETVENLGSFEVSSDESMKVRMNTTDGVQLASTVFKAIPPQTIWGFFAFDNDVAFGEIVQEKIDELNSMAAQDIDLLYAGHYGHFSVNENGINWIRDFKDEKKYNVFFLLKSDGNDDEIVEAFEVLRDEYSSENLGAKMLFWDGRTY